MGNITMCEALKELMKDLDRAKARADREGWIDADEAERIYIAQSGVKETSRCNGQEDCREEGRRK